MRAAAIAVLLVAGLVCGFMAIAGLLTGNTATQYFAIPAFLIGGLVMRLTGPVGKPPLQTPQTLTDPTDSKE